MAGVDFELKDDELLDFDGSEYEYGSEEEDVLEAHTSQLNEGSNEGMQPKPNGKVTKEEGETEGNTDVDRISDREKVSDRRMRGESKRKHGTRSELEDGELIDMRNATDREPERSGVSRHDRKRRREPYDVNRHPYDSRDRRDRSEKGRFGSHDRSFERQRDRRHGSDSRSRGGSRSHPDYHPNFPSGFMGPSRPFRPPPVHPSLEASLGRFSPAQLQELLLQEHMLRSQQMMHLARLGVRPPRPLSPVYPPPFGPSFPRHPPMWGPEVAPFGRGPRSMGPGILGIGGDGMPSNGGRDGRRTPSRAQATDSRGERSRSFSGEKLAPCTRSASKDRAPDLNPVPDKTDSSQPAPAKANEAFANTSSIIQLGGPVQKSRVLTVSGLIENTPMSTIAEAFEKQGRVLDFQKNLTGDVFTVTYSTVQEALSAKRHLHRSILGGRQVTVEFAALPSE